MIKRTIVTGLILLIGAGNAAGQDREDRDARRSEIARRMRELTRELSQLQSEQMSMTNLFVSGGNGPLAFTFGGSRARMGVVVQTVRETAIDTIGALIESVTEDAPAAAAGIEDGDIIVSFDGEPLVGRYPPASDRESEPAIKLIDLVKEHDPGDRVEVVYMRDGETRTTEVELEENAPTMLSYSFSTIGGDSDRMAFLTPSSRLNLFERRGPNFQATVRIVSEFADMELVSLNEDLGAYFGSDEGLLVITAPDEDFGLRAGDVILKIGDRSVDEPSRAFRILGSYEPGEEVTMDIMRQQHRETITGTIPQRDGNVYWNRRR